MFLPTLNSCPTQAQSKKFLPPPLVPSSTILGWINFSFLCIFIVLRSGLCLLFAINHPFIHSFIGQALPGALSIRQQRKRKDPSPMEVPFVLFSPVPSIHSSSQTLKFMTWPISQDPLTGKEHHFLSYFMFKLQWEK